MSTSPHDPPLVSEGQQTASRSTRRIVFVAGSGRSGTSTVSGALQLLGLRVPTPEVPPDESNPKGFAESQWVVDFHDQLLERARIHGADARPQAWLYAGELAIKENLRARLHDWLEEQFQEADELVIKDPRLAWFIGLWRASALRAGATVAFVTMLRPPTEVISSKERYYGGKRANASRTAAWINMMLHTERATRGTERIFLRYDDLLSDWTNCIYRIGEGFDLQSVKTAGTHDIRRVHQFIDPSLHRLRLTWEDLEVPSRLRELAEETWEQLNKFAEPSGETLVSATVLDSLRHEYTELYAEAEAIAKSSINAARMRADRATADAEQAREQLRLARSNLREAKKNAVRPVAQASLADRVARRVPHNVRKTVPPPVRRRVRALLDQRSRRP